MEPRHAVAVDDDRGMYKFTLGASPIPFQLLKEEINCLEVVERLMGWSPWTTVISTDLGTYFVDGAEEPEEFGLADD